jgi:hypothetical protein
VIGRLGRARVTGSEAKKEMGKVERAKVRLAGNIGINEFSLAG